MKKSLITALVLLTFASMFSVFSTPASASAWCNRWHERCLQTGGVPSVCEDRLAQCKSDPKQCYFFYNPGPRCVEEKFVPTPPSALDWCTRWNDVCLQTGGVPSICQSRLAQCKSDPKHCYFFNNPGPWCLEEKFVPGTR